MKKIGIPITIFVVAMAGLLSAPAVFAQTVLQNNTTLYNLFGGTRYYRIDVPVGKARLSIQTQSSDVGDCDVYIRRGALPTTGQFDFRSINYGNNESITVTSPDSGTWYIMLYDYSPYLSLTLEVSYSGTTQTNVSVGNMVWDFSLDGSIHSEPCIAPDGTIYVGTSGPGGAGNFYALNSDGTMKWRKYLSDVSASPALGSDGTIYVNKEAGQLLAVSPSGSVRWTFSRKTDGYHSVAIGKDDIIYVPSDGNSLLAVNANNTLKWEFTVESGYLASSPPVIAPDGTVYCGFYNSGTSIGRLYAVRPNGTEKWRYQVSQQINTPAVDGSGTVIFGVPYPVNKVYAIYSNGAKKWESQVAGGSYYSECYVYSPPVIGVDGTVYISSNRRLVALNTSNGIEKWHHDNGVLLVEFDYANGPAVDKNGIVYYGSSGIYGSGSLYAVNPNGTQAWSYNVGSEIYGQPTISADGWVIFGTADWSSLKLIALKGSGPAAQSAWPLARRNLANTASLEGLGVTINTHPQDQTVKVGTNVIFNVTAAGASQLLYQWRKNGFILPGKTDFTLTISNVQVADQGSYSVVVSNAFGSVTSSNALLTVIVPDTTKPTIAVTSPTSGQRWNNAVFAASGTAKDNAQVTNVSYQLNGTGWHSAQTLNGWTNWTANVLLSPGSNFLQTFATDSSGNSSTTNSVSLVYVLSAVLRVQANGNGTANPNYNGQLLEIGKAYTMTATAGKGFAFVNWTGSLTANAAKLAFVMASNLTFTANFKDNTRPVNVINAPTANQRWSNSLFTVIGKAKDNVGITAVFYQLNTDSWRTALTANFWTNWTAGLTLAPGINTIRTCAVDAAGNVSLTNTVKLVYVLADRLTVQTTGSGSVSPNYNGKMMEIGKTFSMTAKAAKGFAFLNWTGSLTANAAKLTFVMASNLTFTASFADVKRPVSVITVPAVNKLVTNEFFTATGKASDNVGVSNVWYQLNGTGWFPVTTTNIFTNWTALGLAPATGANLIQAFAVDAAGNVSLTNSVKFSH